MVAYSEIIVGRDLPGPPGRIVGFPETDAAGVVRDPRGPENPPGQSLPRGLFSSCHTVTVRVTCHVYSLSELRNASPPRTSPFVPACSLECALTKNAPATLLECALTKSLDLKSFRIRTCQKTRWGKASRQ